MKEVTEGFRQAKKDDQTEILVILLRVVRSKKLLLGFGYGFFSEFL